MYDFLVKNGKYGKNINGYGLHVLKDIKRQSNNCKFLM